MDKKINFSALLAITCLLILGCSSKSKPIDVASNPIPESYQTPATKPGLLERVSYFTPNAAGDSVEKSAFVYLPYNYSPDNLYDVMYIIHGGGESNDVVLGTESDPTILKTAIDHLILEGKMKPIIIVAPTFYTQGGEPVAVREDAREVVHVFQKELRDEILPLIESKYSVYGNGNSPEPRKHRAIGGFSMGGVCTWYAFMENMDLFSVFVPISGDSWVIEALGGGKYAKETANTIAASIAAQGFTPKDFFIFSATGKQDIAYPNLYPQIEAMIEMPEYFSFGPDIDSNNLYYMEDEEGIHWWPWIHKYLFNIIPFLYPAQ